MATHVTSPQTTRPKTPPMPQEDIGSVLHRFQKWAGHQPEPVRELTYEEAVARSRRRVYAENIPAPPEQKKPAASTEDAKLPALKTKAAKSTQTGTAEPAGKSASKSARAAGGKATKASSRKAAAQSSMQSTEAEPAPRNAAGSAYQAIRKASGQNAPDPKMPGEVISAPTASFEQALAAQIQVPAPAPLAIHADTKPVAPLSSDAPAVHLTVRFAKEERDTVRERAHDLGITPSAYMRHCILEIDSLRAELEAARLAYAHASGAAISSQSPAFQNGSLLSLRRRSTLSLRAPGSPWLTRLVRWVLPQRASAH